MRGSGGHGSLPPRRFITDVHLAKLARHLRMLGFDTLWWKDAADQRLLQVSRAESRILLTRDRALYESADPAFRHYVQAIRSEAQLFEVLRAFSLASEVEELELPLSRCLDCNALIREASLEEVRHRVPPGVLEAQTAFYLCPGCGRVYWEGSHFDHMQERVRAILERERGAR